MKDKDNKEQEEKFLDKRAFAARIPVHLPLGQKLTSLVYLRKCIENGNVRYEFRDGETYIPESELEKFL